MKKFNACSMLALFLFISATPVFETQMNVTSLPSLSISQVTERRQSQDSLTRFDQEAALKEAQEKKIPKSDLQGWLEYKRAEFMQKQNGTWERVIPDLHNPRIYGGACPNGNFEYGAFNNWQAFAGSNNSNGLSLAPSAALSGRHTIMSGGGFDPVVGGTTLPIVNAGNYSARIGNSLGGSQAEGLRYSFTVTNQNQNFTFSYALVLQYAEQDHYPFEEPFFMYELKNSSGATIQSLKKIADPNDQYFKSINSQQYQAVVYKNWDCMAIDLSAYLGQSLTITFVTADCTKSGHWGYAYIDDICSSDITASFTLPAEVCSNNSIVADATASHNEIDYFWSIEESDANWGRNPTTEVMQWFPAQQAGVMDLKAFYASKGNQFKCNTYYRIKLAVRNTCVPWKETVKLLYIKCSPEADAGPDKHICCKDIQSVQIGKPPVPGYTYSWTSDPPGFTSTSAMPSVPPQCATYTLTVTNQHGCSSTDTVGVIIDKPFDINLTQSPQTAYPCDSSAILSPEIIDLSQSCTVGPGCPTFGRVPQVKYLWSTGQTTGTIGVNPSSPTTYSVTVSNACGSRTAQIMVQPCPPFTGNFPQLLFPNAFTPNGDGNNDTFKIIHYGSNAPGLGQGPAYNAINWKFIVWDRWGHEIVHLDGGNDKRRCEGGIPNGSIPNWNGRADNNSMVLPQGAYVWRLYLKNCTFKDWFTAETASVTIIR
ncbi:MAG TPA: gliding motility-associated C-terminal domain-containing protein [Blastocatellia bacterium]|nr:gliding motility-associated C-terminal domain-containing protein [Blastocatellia bacterium]